MKLKNLIINAIPRRVRSLVPSHLRAKMKRQILSSSQGNPSTIDGATTAPENRPVLLNTLGFPIYNPINLRPQITTETSLDTLRQFQLPEIKFEGRQGTVLVSICAMNYLHFARTLINSIWEQYTPTEIAIYLLIVDWDGQEPLSIPDTTCLAGRAIGIDRFDYMALKYTVAQLCWACKPYLIHYMMATTSYHKLLYLDIDIYVFARLDQMLACLDEAKLVVIPHTLTPIPNRDRFNERPSLGDLIHAGTYNAGMFGMTVMADNAMFITQWIELVTTPGDFPDKFERQNEQKFFNWLAGLADGVKVFKDTAYNVAYWNLHDRSLRYTGWDERNQKPGWRVDGKPLVAFHFSGISLDEPHRLSLHDSRYHLYFLPSVTTLIEFYLGKLFMHGALAARERGYLYDRFTSGLYITSEIRQIFKKYETSFWSELSPWSEVGERYYSQCLFLPVPQTSSLLPIALYQIYQRRTGLQATFPQAHLDPQPILNWFSHSGINEEPVLYEYFNRYRPFVPRLAGVQIMLQLQQESPALFAGLEQPLSTDMTKLLSRLKDAGLEKFANRVLGLEFENLALSPIYLLWKFVEKEPHLRVSFPDILFADAPGFSQWLRQHGPNHFFEPELAEIFWQKAQGRSLARIFIFLNRKWEFANRWPLALIGQSKEDCVRALLTLLQHDLEFDLDDIIMYLWIMAVKPWAGLPLTFELLVNACRQPSPLLPEGQEALLGPLLAEPGFRMALNTYRHQTEAKKLDGLYARRYQRQDSVMVGWPHLGLEQRRQAGVNFFGYFKSAIGLGSLSRGLALAFRSVGVKVQENVLGSIAMEQDLQPEDFIRIYDYSLDTNLFLSYPHLPERLLAMYPQHIIKERKNIVYLAWEQRDGYPGWARDYAEFDQIWALSHFAATSFCRYMQRDDVLTVPGVIDFKAFPAPATKQEMDLNPDRFTFLYIFDANSSIERKNPEAVIEAFIQAFSPHDKVQLLLKVSNAHRLEHRQKLRQLANLATRSDLDIHFLLVNLPYPQLLRLVSAADCYVSLHRAEGFGYTCAEAMAYAKPVIATNYSATTEFMDSESAFLVDYREGEVKVADGPFQRGSVWAEPSVAHAASLMRQIYSNQKAAQKIGQAGQVKVRQLLSPERAGRIAAAALTGQAYQDVK